MDMNLIALLTECYLTEGYPEAQRDFSLTASPEEVTTTIATYKDLVNRNQVQGNERNIDYWRKQGWDAFLDFTTTKSQLKSKTQTKRSKSPGKSIVLEETPEWLIVIPLDEDASCYHGKNTDWCTAKQFTPHFAKYFHDRNAVLIYFLQLKTGKKWAQVCYLDTSVIEAYDENDQMISTGEFARQTQLKMSLKYQTLAFSAINRQTYSTIKQTYKEVLDYVNSNKPFTQIDSKIEQSLLFLKRGDLINEYCVRIKGRWPEAEQIIAKDPKAATSYARDTIHDRWPEAEKFILRAHHRAYYIYKYALEVIGGRWPEAEKFIATDMFNARQYAENVIKSTWASIAAPEVDKAILDSEEGADYQLFINKSKR